MLTTNDVIIIGGQVIDPDKPELGIVKKDIGIRNGVFVPAHQLDTSTTTVINAENHYVSPGFIDLHVHVFNEHAKISIDADRVGITQGVTTIVDAGSSGFDVFDAFRDHVIRNHKTEVLAFLNIAKKGLTRNLSELADPEDLMNIEEAQEIFMNEKSLVGIKARMSRSVTKDQDVKPLVHARKLADKLGVPIMVHIGNPPPYLPDIFPLLKKGDIVTHAFHGKEHGILNEHHLLIPEALEALKRGVLFDIGHGSDSFNYQTMRYFKKQYCYNFTSSTDAYDKNIQKPVGSLMTTMSKLLELGFSLPFVVQSVTSRSRKALNLKEQGTFQYGTRADVTLFDVKQNPTSFFDSNGNELLCHQVITPFMTIRSGRAVYQL
ncbi:amidohydrolase/deacetylase family metallohydrolase [Sporolactobacillus inulinus]|uniref:amidohydrolase/deacetylase family metallohydrolase n=1 Tax=Sporolactobacillus inulinus TaxID=2078 RepID=UPI00114129B8|nr:amidohydrolase/deacetylase family metallohydrolase [Sporolactobacillus inulinus]GEB76300.1 dihydroorotase [Sporolactobacillus inulinus]